MSPHLFYRRLLPLLFLLGMAAGAWAENPANEAIQLYRAGKFTDAEARFSQLHGAQPEDTRITYYLAMTQAQLGRFDQARKLYNEVLLLEPNSQVAALAEQGLKYLPAAGTALDLPPRFQSAGAEESSPATGAAAQTAPPGMNAQDMMAWQMMMSQMGGGQNGQMGGMNPMMMGMPGMTPGAVDPNNPSPYGQMDPNTMSTMMMNSMMQNFSFTDKNDNDR